MIVLWWGANLASLASVVMLLMMPTAPEHPSPPQFPHLGLIGIMELILCFEETIQLLKVKLFLPHLSSQRHLTGTWKWEKYISTYKKCITFPTFLSKSVWNFEILLLSNLNSIRSNLLPPHSSQSGEVEPHTLLSNTSSLDANSFNSP